MNVPVNFFMWMLAILPIIVLLILMIKFNWSATKAALVGLLITAITSLLFYKADLRLLAIESVKGAWSALPIILITWTAILLYQVGSEARAFLVIRNGMQKLLPNELLLILAMGWIFESFLQGITGFGVPVAVGAPLLMGIGVEPLYAVILPLIGQAWGNTFGTLGAAWDSLAMSAGLEMGSPLYIKTAFWTAAFLLIWNVIGGMAICWFYGKGTALKKGFAAVLILSMIQGGGELLLSQVNTTIANFIPACVSMIVILVLGQTKTFGKKWKLENSPIMKRQTMAYITEKAPENMNLLQAFVPYILLSVSALIVLLVHPINRFLGKFKFGFRLPETTTGYGFVNAQYYQPLSLFTHASMFLLVAAIIGLIYYKGKGWIKKGGESRVFVESFSMTKSSAFAVLCLVIMSNFMAGTGQTSVLADGISGLLGKVCIILAPFVGLLGTFMTGSNVSSNILFGNFQMQTSGLLQADPSYILGAQSVGGAIGSAISPSKIILGTTTADISGAEGRVMEKLMALTILSSIFIGLMAYILVGANPL